MSVRSFFDTNVLVYTDDRGAPVKQAIALGLFDEHLRAGSGVLSLQVLQEYFAASRKMGVEAALARQKIELFATLDVVLPGVEDLLGAIDLHRLHALSIWDALVIRAAQRSGCEVLLTEDLQHGQTFDGVQIVNPFQT
jgi:predicted nucleic acid-binding protein